MPKITAVRYRHKLRLLDEDPHAAACRAIALGTCGTGSGKPTSGYALSLSGGADSALCGTFWFAQVQAALTLGEEPPSGAGARAYQCAGAW